MKIEKRILSLDPVGLLWGSERALLDFIGEIPGFETACCCPPKTPLIEKLKTNKVACFPTFQSNLHRRGIGARILALGGLLRALWAFRPDVLHVNQAGVTRLALIACRILRIPCVAHVRLEEDVEYLNHRRPSPRYLRRLIAVSQSIADLIETQPHLKNIPCSMLRDAYRPQSWHSSEPASREKPDEASWDFVCVGRFCEDKGQEVLIRALSILRQHGASPKVVFVGEVNAQGAEMQRLVTTLELSDHITFVGHKDNVFNILRQSSWLVCPSRYESLGRVLFEAWDAGIPVIGGAFAGGAAASIKESGGGLLFDQWSPEFLAKVLLIALACPQTEIAAMAMAGCTWMKEATDPNLYTRGMAEIFHDAMS